MEDAARRFARNILILHLALFALVVAILLVVSRETYQAARAQALDQLRSRQTLLVTTTASGIETYYSAILNNLDLLRKAEAVAERQPQASQPAAAPLPGLRAKLFAPLLWNQISDRASHLLAVDRSGRIVEDFSNEDSVPAEQIVQANLPWLASVTQEAVSPALYLAGRRVNLLASPVPSRPNLLLVAVVPIEGIEKRFLAELNRPETSVSAMLLDASANIMVHHDPRLVGRDVHGIGAASVAELVDKYLRLGTAGDELFENPVVLVDSARPGERVVLNPGLTRIQPINLGGHRWWLVVSSGLKDVDQVVGQTFLRAMLWALFAVIAMTAVLVSSSVQLIRGRSRLEHVRHELLTRELDQARQIQLAWLPSDYQPPRRLDLGAVNQPASHISGDFYNWFELPDKRVAISIGDVTGHGMAAAFLMATTQLLVRMTLMRLGDPGQALEEVNRQLCAQQANGNGQFVTMLLLVLDLEHDEIDVATAGHYPPLLGDGECFRPLNMEPRLVLGVEADTVYATEHFDLPPRASLLLFTDGVLDAQSPDGQRFSQAKLEACLAGDFDSAQAIIDRVVETLTAFRGQRDLPDDMTLVALHLQPTRALANA